MKKQADQARMRRHGSSQTSPERTRPPAEPPKNPPLEQPPPQGRKVPVVYYLCKNRHLEHPHFIEVQLSSPEGLYLRDVIGRLNVLRGKGMAAMYSWSCKRSYKNGFVWHDLAADDLILPAHGSEYVLKGSELLDQSPPDRMNRSGTSTSVNSCKNQEIASCGSSSLLGKNSSRLRPPASPSQLNLPPPEDLSPSTNRSSSSGNFSPSPVRVQDASTQTDDVQRGKKREGGLDAGSNAAASVQDAPSDKAPEIVEEERLPAEAPPLPTQAQSNASSSSSSSWWRTGTLESLIQDEVSQRKEFRIVEEEQVFAPARAKMRAADVLVQLITCGSISVKDHYNFGIVPTYKPMFGGSKSPSTVFSGSMMLGEIDLLSESQRVTGLRLEEKRDFSGLIAETRKDKVEMEGELSTTKSTCFEDDDDEEEGRSKNMGDSEKHEEMAAESARWKCLPRAIKIASCKQSWTDQAIKSPGSGARMVSAGSGSAKSSPLNSLKAGSRRISEDLSNKGSPIGLQSFREDKEEEKAIKIDENLLLGRGRGF